jgi:hypothetical protein
VQALSSLVNTGLGDAGGKLVGRNNCARVVYIISESSPTIVNCFPKMRHLLHVPHTRARARAHTHTLSLSLSVIMGGGREALPQFHSHTVIDEDGRFNVIGKYLLRAILLSLSNLTKYSSNFAKDKCHALSSSSSSSSFLLLLLLLLLLLGLGKDLALVANIMNIWEGLSFLRERLVNIFVTLLIFYFIYYDTTWEWPLQ